jgi:hypothetical protein
MTKYLLFTLGSFGCFIYLFLTWPVYSDVMPRYEFYTLTSPILISISAGLFITNKTKGASIFGLLGLAIVSKDILSNWFIIGLFDSRYIVQLLAFVSLTTIYLFLLSFITIKSLLSLDKDLFEIIKYQPSGSTAKVLSFIPTVIVVIATIVWLITIQIMISKHSR